MIVEIAHDAVVFRELSEFLRGLLAAIPAIADQHGEPGISTRIFSSPGCEEEPGFAEDWKAYVRPGLEHIFTSANEVVRRDCENIVLDEARDRASLRIPLAHVASWLNSLNQARLVLATRHQFEEGDMARKSFEEIATGRDLDLLRVHFYGFLQENLIEALNAIPPGE